MNCLISAISSIEQVLFFNLIAFCFLHKKSFSVVSELHVQIHRIAIDFHVHLMQREEGWDGMRGEQRQPPGGEFIPLPLSPWNGEHPFCRSERGRASTAKSHRAVWRRWRRCSLTGWRDSGLGTALWPGRTLGPPAGPHSSWFGGSGWVQRFRENSEKYSDFQLKKQELKTKWGLVSQYGAGCFFAFLSFSVLLETGSNRFPVKTPELKERSKLERSAPLKWQSYHSLPCLLIAELNLSVMPERQTRWKVQLHNKHIQREGRRIFTVQQSFST